MSAWTDGMLSNIVLKVLSTTPTHPSAMPNSERSGRPVKARNPVAGKNLWSALKILGKTWRKNTHDSDHIQNWTAWAALGLPRSATTIDADIRLGVPEERMEAYAKCLGLSQGALGSPDTDMRELIGHPGQDQTVLTPLLGLDFGTASLESFRTYNSRQHLKKLFNIIGGVYIVHYTLPIADFINRCVFWFRDVTSHHITGNGLFIRFGLENFFVSNTFIWHNNLHTTYLCDNNKELGHFLLVDPLRHNLVAKRDPFWMKGAGVTDSGLAENAPVHFTFRMEKLANPSGLPPDALWERECRDLRRRPSIQPDEPDHAVLKEAILAPDPLL